MMRDLDRDVFDVFEKVQVVVTWNPPPPRGQTGC